MKLNCTLVKTTETYLTKDKFGKEVTKKITRFQLFFENGDVVPVELRNFVSKDDKKQEKLDDMNYRNYIIMTTHADCFDNPTKEGK